MSEVLKLLESENRCLKKFLIVSENYLKITQARLNANEEFNFNDLEEFQKKREKSFKSITLHQKKISELVQRLSATDKTPELIEMIKKIIKDRQYLVQILLNNDNSIIESFDEAKNQLNRKLAESERSSQLVQKFKSQWVMESGEQLDGQL